MAFWSRNKQAETAQRVLELVQELHIHVTDLIAGSDLTEVERELRHALKVLRSRDEAS